MPCAVIAIVHSLDKAVLRVPVFETLLAAVPILACTTVAALLLFVAVVIVSNVTVVPPIVISAVATNVTLK